MAKILGQNAPADTNNHVLVSGNATINWLSICNKDSSAHAARLWVAYDSSDASDQNALLYDKSVPANDVVVWELPFSIRGGAVTVRSDSAGNLAFTAYGKEG